MHHHTHHRMLQVALLALATGLSSVCSAQLRAPVTPVEFAAEALPTPQMKPGEERPACVTAAQAAASLRVESPAVTAQYRKDSRLLATVNVWTNKHLSAGASPCLEWPYVVRKLQEVLGHEATGVLTLADLAKVAAALAQGEHAAERKVLAKVEGQDLSSGRARSIVDFLPKIGNSFDRSCNALMGRAQARTRQEVARRVAQLPMHMMRPAHTEAIEREELARASSVAPQWQAFWRAQPAMEQWAQANDCNAPLRIKIEAWQLVTGAPANALDPQAIAASEQLLAQAEERLSQFGGQLEQSLQAQADASGETARARTWSLDALSARSSLSELAGQIPTALCTAGDNRLRCAVRQACAAEQQVATAARGQRGYDQLTRPLAGRFEAPPPSVGTNVDRLAQAEDALKVCMTRHPYTAAAKSALLFAGQALSAAELDFDARGLAAMRLSLAGDAEAVRQALTRKYGVPDTQQQTRVRTESRMTGGGTAYTDTGRAVTVNPTVQQVEVPYSVTRYVWKTPQVLVEEVTGMLQFRFSGH